MTTIAGNPIADSDGQDQHSLPGMETASTLLDRFGTGRAILLGGTVVAALLALSDEDGPILCPFRRCTGGYCPGCGLTRSGGRLVRGDVVGSWQQHPFMLLGLIQAAVVAALWRFGSASLQRSLRSLTARFLQANLVLLVGVWVVRLLDGSIPIPFAG